MRDRVELLSKQMAEVYGMLRDRLHGLTEDEFWWEPVPGCWTVRQVKGGRWAADYEEPDPEPAPFTTIAWRLAHIATCKVMYHEYAFGPAALTWDSLYEPHTVADAIGMLEEGQASLERDLVGLEDAELEELRPTNWGEKWPAWRIFWTMIHHDLHHGAEIGTLRDLYRVTQ